MEMAGTLSFPTTPVFWPLFFSGVIGMAFGDVAYFTASVDSVEKNTEFAKSLDLDYPILSDPSTKVAEAFGCLNARKMSNRWTYYIGKDNKILYIDK